MNFDQSFDIVFKHEGGFTDDPRDRGNWTSGQIGIGECRGTKYGITAMSYPLLDIKHLSKDQAKQIYRRDYWDRICGDELPVGVGFQVFDGAVNSGIGNSARWLQAAVGTKPDGAIGPKTVDAAKKMLASTIIMRYNANRLEFLASTSAANWATYGRGWVNRVAANLKL